MPKCIQTISAENRMREEEEGGERWEEEVGGGKGRREKEAGGGGGRRRREEGGGGGGRRREEEGEGRERSEKENHENDKLILNDRSGTGVTRDVTLHFKMFRILVCGTERNIPQKFRSVPHIRLVTLKLAAFFLTIYLNESLDPDGYFSDKQRNTAFIRSCMITTTSCHEYFGPRLIFVRPDRNTLLKIV